MTTATQISGVDANITRVMNTLRANRGLSTQDLIAKSGIAESTYHRRRKHGGWTATELMALAAALDTPWTVFGEDAEGLLPRLGGTSTGLNREYAGVNDGVVEVAA
jgi:hypothetical protein